jgi:polyhydroxybutyrate depolymerase
LLCVSTTLGVGAEPSLSERQWTVDGVTRKALVHIPNSSTKADTPVVFAFHGHGGTMTHAARSFSYHTQWPESIVVYLQGLNTPGALTDPGGKRTGWQRRVGDQGNRDLKFFGTVLASLKSDFKIDDKRIYATGHSNGGSFTYLLWAARGEVFAAVAPCAAIPGASERVLSPKPALQVAGEKDALVRWDWQARAMERVRKLNGCDDSGKPWDQAGALTGTIYRSKTGTPFVSVVYPGGHAFPREAPGLITKFFKEHAKK